MVRDVTDMMDVRAREKGLRLLVDQSSQFPRYIVGDEARLRQVLINLVGNAIKFTEQGGVTVRLGTKNNAIAHLLLEVEDSGPGIAQEDQQRIFEPFEQLGSSGGNQGTGLGLSITRQFVQLMGGRIELESTPGKGSLFRIDLPLKQADKADVTRLGDVEKGEVVGLAPGQPEYRILVVEDQLENRLLLAKLMESVGFQVKSAENGQQGVELFQSWRPHLIWMDHRMPIMDGDEATRTIRSLPGGKDVKIVAVTASAFSEQRTELLKAGMDDFLRKPYRFNEIYECVSKQLGVQYTYRGATASMDEASTLTPEMLSILPETLRQELMQALESLNSDRIETLIQQVAMYDANLQKALAYLANNFDYPTILKALHTL
jgi:CheY-like chemotaxis protein/anti-sigma regulatory factor (Ser/Thr protein kinase)